MSPYVSTRPSRRLSPKCPWRRSWARSWRRSQRRSRSSTNRFVMTWALSPTTHLLRDLCHTATEFKISRTAQTSKAFMLFVVSLYSGPTAFAEYNARLCRHLRCALESCNDGDTMLDAFPPTPPSSDRKVATWNPSGQCFNHPSLRPRICSVRVSGMVPASASSPIVGSHSIVFLSIT